MKAAALMARPADGASAQPVWAEGALPRLALAGLVVLQTALILTHVPWRDELQAIMLAQHSGSLGALFASLRYEGHPALWYLLLRTLSPLGSPATTLKLVQLAVALPTIAIVWTRAPFGPWTRILILAGYFLLFEWSAIARSYGLGMLLCFAFLALHRQGIVAYLLLGLMANVAAPFLVLAGASALLLFFIEKERSVVGLLVFAVLCLVAVVTAWPAPDAYTVATLASDTLVRVISAFGLVSGALVPIDPGLLPPHWAAWPIVPIGLVVAALGTLGLLRNRTAAALFLLTFAGICALAAFVYPLRPRHAGVIFLFLIASEWLLAERGEGPVSVFSQAWIIVLAAVGLWISAWALVIPFTAMGEAAHAIDERGLKDARWAAHPAFVGVEVSARLGQPYYDVQRQCLSWFQKWDAASAVHLDPATLAARLKAAAAASGGRVMLLTNEKLDDPSLRLVEGFDPGLLLEAARIYEVSAPPDADTAPLQACQ